MDNSEAGPNSDFPSKYAPTDADVLRILKMPEEQFRDWLIMTLADESKGHDYVEKISTAIQKLADDYLERSWQITEITELLGR